MELLTAAVRPKGAMEMLSSTKSQSAAGEDREEDREREREPFRECTGHHRNRRCSKVQSPKKRRKNACTGVCLKVKILSSQDGPRFRKPRHVT